MMGKEAEPNNRKGSSSRDPLTTCCVCVEPGQRELDDTDSHSQAGSHSSFHSSILHAHFLLDLPGSELKAFNFSFSRRVAPFTYFY